VVLRYDFWWGAALAALAGIPRRVGYDVAECLPFLTDPAPYEPGKHEVMQNLRLILRLTDGPYPPGDQVAPDHAESDGGSEVAWTSGLDLDLRPSAADHGRAKALLLELSPGLPHQAGPIVAVHPGAGAAVKLWPAERWAALSDAVARRWNAAIVLTGSAAERPLTEAIAQHMRRPALNLSGRTSLGELAAVFGQCDLVLGVDSGPLHMAVAVDTPTVHLFGPVSPAAFGPWGDPVRHVVIQASYGETPCHGHPCDRLDYPAKYLAQHRCMATIALEDVLAAAEGLLSRTARISPEGYRAGAEGDPET
jgi:ADP-heptose:LPS heptosyltransferase